MGFNHRDVARAGRKVYEAAAAADVGPFHLVRVGDRAAFRARRLLSGVDTRIAR